MDDYENEIEIELEEKEGGIVDDELQAAISAEISDAIDYIDEDISPDRAKATKYYKGEPFGNEEEGSSQYVSTDVRDTVLGIMPNLMRIFAGAERIAEFAPVGPEDVEGAEQATDAVHYVFSKQNAGFLTLYACFKDALVRKTGIIKWWTEEKIDTNEYEYEGLGEEDFAVLVQDPDVEVLEMEVSQDLDPMDPMGQAMLPAIYEVTIRRTKKSRKYCIAAVPPEEFLIDRRARDEDNASFVGQRQMLTVSDLVAMGYDKEMVMQYAGSGDDELETNEERYARNPQLTIFKTDRSDDASKKVLYVEGYARYDRDGDGIAELVKVCTMGSAYNVISVEGCDEIPFAMFCSDPEPHTAIGLSEADKVMDIQRSKSQIMRDMLDSLAQSIRPRTAVVEGQVNMDDVLNNEIGAPIRMRAPGMAQPWSQPFVGQAAFPVLAYFDETKEARTGVSKASMGLNADALQSSTRAAVAATISSAQGRVELIARVFAETGMKRLFRGILRMLITHQDQPMMMRLRGKFVQMDPKVWNADMDVEINIALSAAGADEKMAVLNQVSLDQKEVLMTMGLQNPMVTLSQYRNTRAKMLELAGFKNTDYFYQEIAPDWQPPQEQPKPTPEEMLAQVQMQSIQADIEKKAAELQIKREEMIRTDDRARDKLEADTMLRAAEIQAKYGTEVNIAHIHAMMERDREAMKQQSVVDQAVAQAAMMPQAMPPQAMPQEMPQQMPPEMGGY